MKFVLTLWTLITSASLVGQTLSFDNEVALRYETFAPNEETHLSDRNFQTDFRLPDSIANSFAIGSKFFDDNLLQKYYKNGTLILNSILLSQITRADKLYFIAGGGIAVNKTYKNWTFESALFGYATNDSTIDYKVSASKFPAFFRLNYRPNDFFNFEIGKGKTFFGHGYNSLLLSENAAAYPYFRTSVNVWRVRYVWQIGKLSDYPLLGTQAKYALYDKYAFWHYLSINLTKRLNFNFFEVVMTNPYGHKLERAGVDLAYFNPVIFYRPVEFAEGTLDNALMGIGLNIRIFKSTYLYSQFLLDDMIMSRLTDGSGWWANKFGIQAGLKSHNLFKIKGLNFIGEINAVRPYTYSHGDMSFGTMPSLRNMNLNYGMFTQPLAHPSGSNFAEMLTHISYMRNRFVLSITISITEKGFDTEELVSLGGDIYKSYHLRPDDFGTTYLQGNLRKAATAELKLKYIVNPKALLELEAGFRAEQLSNPAEKKTYIFGGLRTAIF